MKKEVWILIILSIMIIILDAILMWPSAPDNKQQNISIEGIQIFSPTENETISSPLKITGIVNGNGWAGFEGQVGTVKLLNRVGKELATGVLTATTEWTKLPTSFETTLNFQTSVAQQGTLVFKNENPSGDSSKDKTFSFPITIK